MSNCVHVDEWRPCLRPDCNCFLGHKGQHHDALGRTLADHPDYRAEWKP